MENETVEYIKTLLHMDDKKPAHVSLHERYQVVECVRDMQEKIDSLKARLCQSKQKKGDPHV